MYISNVNSTSMQLNHIELENINEDQSYHLDSHDELVILYINKGAANYTYQDQSGEIKKHNIVILNPNQSITFEPVRKMEWFRLQIDGILFTSSHEIDSTHQLFIVMDHTYILRDYLNLAISEHEHRFRGSDIVLRKLLECVMVHILRHNELSIKDADTQAKNQEIEQVQKYIRDHHHEKVTLDQLADLVDINKYYLIRLFKQKTGLSPIDYLIHLRLDEAEKLLANTDITISKISEMVGFHSPSHFSKTFKETHDCTPSAYRRRTKDALKRNN